MTVNKKLPTKIFIMVFTLLCVFSRSEAVHARDASLQSANVAVSWLPTALVAAARGDRDVPVEIELIFNEKQGVGVSFDQVKRSFIIPNVTTIEEAVKFDNLTLHPGEELHQKTTQIIPLSVVMLALGGASASDIRLKLVYTGVDAQGTSIATETEIPISLTRLAAAETFAVGDVEITSPKQGGKYDYGTKIKATAKISTTGIGNVSGIWLLNGQNYQTFSRDISGQGKAIQSIELPATLAGRNTLQLSITQPVVQSSEAVTFDVASELKTPDSVSEFFSGPFHVKSVSATFDKKTGAFSGAGTLLLPAFELEVPVTFTGFTIALVDGKPVFIGGTAVEEVNKTVERGTMKVEITGLLLSATGVFVDGTIALGPSLMTPGIGPLFIYGMPVGENGLDGKVVMKEPQKGSQGDYAVDVDRFEIRLTRSVAALKVSGIMTKPQDPKWKTPLSISVSFGEDIP